jgi:radical SAM additional 4Fe4S-binding domain
MGKIFRLNSFCHIVDGHEKGCIYNLISGDMISIDNNKLNVLLDCEKNIPIDLIPNVDINFINELESLGLGMFYDKPVYIDRLSTDIPDALEVVVPMNYRINSFYIEIENKCNLDCVFCNKNDDTLFRKTGCKRWKISSGILDINNWKNVIDQVSKLSCNQIVFIGGEPLLNFEYLSNLVPYIKEHKISNILLYTNGTLINDEIIEFIKKYNIHLNIQLLSDNEITYEEITGKKGLENIVYNNICKINSSNINYKLSFLVNKFNENQVDSTLRKYNPIIGNKKFELDFLYPIPQNNFYSKKYFNLLYDKKKTFSKIYMESYSYLKKYHPCYANKLAITLDGNLIPCIMSRKLVLGNIRDSNIVSILKDSQFNYLEKLTKDKIAHCKNCAYRYGCFDCRALEMAATGDLCGLEYCDIKPGKE